tara:strand:- start:305 stop:1087 length:783 start_codon:yes stop_codon:yes gene_type:complete
MYEGVKFITIIKNRLEHFLKTFPFMVSQYGLKYDLMIVDYHSNDNFQKNLLKEINFRKDTFSPYLQKIVCIKLLEDLKFSTKKSKNLGAAYCSNEDILVFTDIDVLVSMDYLSYWVPKTKRGRTFVTTRWKDTMVSLPTRIEPEINYGNFFVCAEDYYKVCGMDESLLHWGGADDDIFHRLKLSGLQEINPYNSTEAKQYSILHGDDLRLSALEDTTRYDSEQIFKKIFSNDSRLESKENKFLNYDFASSISEKRVLYEK